MVLLLHPFINATGAAKLQGMDVVAPAGPLLGQAMIGRRRVARPAQRPAPEPRSTLEPIAQGSPGLRAEQLLNEGIDKLERRMQGHRLRNIDIHYRPGYGAREDLLDADLLVALLEQRDGAMYGQAGGQLRDGKGGFHAGVGYRHLLGRNRDLLFGVNAFYDVLLDPGVSRWSLGVEHKSRLLDLYANWYQGAADDGTLYSPDGWDVEFAGRLPLLTWLELAGRHYSWERQGAGDLSGQEYTASLQPLSLAALQLYYDHPNSAAPAAWGVGFNVKYRFGVSLREQLRPRGDQVRAPVYRRFERARREYEQRVQDSGVAPLAGGGTAPLVIDVGSSLVSGGSLGREFPRQDSGLAVVLVLNTRDSARAGTVAVRFGGAARFGLDYQVSDLLVGSTRVLVAERFDVPLFTRFLSFSVNIDTAPGRCSGCDITMQVDGARPVRLLTITAAP